MVHIGSSFTVLAVGRLWTLAFSSPTITVSVHCKLHQLMMEGLKVQWWVVDSGGRLFIFEINSRANTHINSLSIRSSAPQIVKTMALTSTPPLTEVRNITAPWIVPLNAGLSEIENGIHVFFFKIQSLGHFTLNRYWLNMREPYQLLPKKRFWFFSLPKVI